jgi:sugar/nucleoside kinase (ribokinase family)
LPEVTAAAEPEGSTLVVVGDVMIDVSVEAGPLALGGDVRGEVRVRPGGTGANTAVWAASEGARVALFGRVGDDLPGRLLAEALAERGVDCRLAVDSSARTGTMLVIRQEGERSMIADRGANARLSPADLPDRLQAHAMLVSGYLLFDPGSEPAAVAALARADADLVGVDAASWPLLRDYGGERFLEATARANVLLANEREAEILGDGAPERLTGRYEHVFVKEGPRGARYGCDGRWIHRSAEVAGPVRDTTGAGDAFAGALLTALAGGADPATALARACGAGARAATSLDTWPDPDG